MDRVARRSGIAERIVDRLRLVVCVDLENVAEDTAKLAAAQAFRRGTSPRWRRADARARVPRCPGFVGALCGGGACSVGGAAAPRSPRRRRCARWVFRGAVFAGEDFVISCFSYDAILVSHRGKITNFVG